jgi:hypothetical protein
MEPHDVRTGLPAVSRFHHIVEGASIKKGLARCKSAKDSLVVHMITCIASMPCDVQEWHLHLLVFASQDHMALCNVQHRLVDALASNEEKTPCPGSPPVSTGAWETSPGKRMIA